MARGKATEAQLAALAKARATRAAKRMYAPSLPKGGYRSLMTKKRLTAKAAAWEALSPAMLSGANTQARGANISVRTYGKKSRSSAKKDMTTPIVVVEAAPKTRGKATEKQLAALAKARATRAAKKAGTTVAVAVAAPTTQVKKPRGRPKKTEEQKFIDKANREQKKKTKMD